MLVELVDERGTGGSSICRGGDDAALTRLAGCACSRWFTSPRSTGGGGLFEEIVVARGDALERCVMPETTAGPDAAESYDAIMVFGGAMHPDQDAEHPWLADESAFLRDAIDREVPLLGVCLGAQLIARAAGAGVGRATTRRGGVVRGRAQRRRP